ncbi:hypothetical protein Y032_0126g1304 [Ancylostoma ceylanicum]|uniref:Uncharacterized protein n=1 Tax=Ancylostoma ceylanicum TaxID=53326 RepID=A0A016T7G8_9BILA|nr:hypothetical protein Y032_0126g1304 [Ancylostoma ceylanicum]
MADPVLLDANPKKARRLTYTLVTTIHTEDQLGPIVVDKAEWHRKCAEVCYMISNMEEKDQERVQWLRKDRQHALDAHDLNPTSIAILKILCSTTGRLAEESGIREKINLGFEFKTYLDRAVALQPSSFELLHMRGRFTYQVANLSFFERLAARAIGTLPEASMEAALRDLLELRLTSLL